MKTSFKQFEISSVLSEKATLWPAASPTDPFRYKHNKFSVTVKNTENNSKIKFDFFGSVNDFQNGVIEMDENNLLHAFYCLVSDGLGAAQNDFSNWCAEYGYSYEPWEDKVGASMIKRTYAACCKEWDKVEKLGLDEDSACYLVNELSDLV